MIYFIKAGDKSLKIGYVDNEKNLKRRLSQLQISSPDKLKLIAYFEGSIKKEKELHKKFSSYHIRGEWFDSAFLNQDIKCIIEENSIFIPTPTINDVKKAFQDKSCHDVFSLAAYFVEGRNHHSRGWMIKHYKKFRNIAKKYLKQLCEEKLCVKVLWGGYDSTCMKCDDSYYYCASQEFKNLMGWYNYDDLSLKEKWQKDKEFRSKWQLSNTYWCSCCRIDSQCNEDCVLIERKA